MAVQENNFTSFQKHCKQGLISLVFILAFFPLQAQFNIPLEHDLNVRYSAFFYNSNQAGFHSFVKPLRDDVVWNADSSIFNGYDPSPFRPNPRKETGGSHSKVLEIVPLFEMQGGYDLSGRGMIHRLGGGAALNAFWKQKLAVNFRFNGGTANVPSYLDNFINRYGIIPGIGRAYPTKSAGTYSWQQYTGYVSWSPRRIFNLQAGIDKHFWGEGYRSLFLSDLSAPMPYLKLDTRIWKLQYVNLFGWLKDIDGVTGSKADFRNKFGTFHYLSFNAYSWLNVGVFEAIMWQGTDNNRSRGFDPNYLNPLIFFRPVEFSLGSSDNAFLGFSTKGKFRNQTVYFQLLLDEFYLKEIRAGNGWWANKQGIQLGWKSLNCFHVNGLQFQAEFNFVRPYTYAHGSPQQGYTHFNQPLAHPLGANFTEQVYLLDYRRGYFLYELKFISAVYGLDTAGLNYGHDLFRSYTIRPNDYGNKTGQGLRTQLTILEGHASWLLYAPMNLQLNAGITWRHETNTHWTTNDTFVWLGFRSALTNWYHDF